MVMVGVKELKDHLSEYLRRVHQGERLVVTERGKAVAALGPLEDHPDASCAWQLVGRGVAAWRGGKPLGATSRRKIRGKTTADMVLEDRR